MPSKQCVDCNKWNPIFKERKCYTCSFAHYEKTNDSSFKPPRCDIPGCNKFAEKGMHCSIHYRRILHNGTSEKIRQQGKSEKRQHPYYKNWEHLKRQGVLCSAWLDFTTFISDIGERPEGKQRLGRIDPDVEYGPSNFTWHDKTEYTHKKRIKTTRNRDTRGETLRNNYNITREQYQILLDAQNGTCVFCAKQYDTGSNGYMQPLSIDHDHVTGEIRGLLCRHHNMMLGFANDDPDVLEHAAAYLRHKDHTGWFATNVGDSYKPRSKLHVFDAAKVKNQCSVEGCNKAVKSKGMCQAHYVYLNRHNTLEKPVKTVLACSEPNCNRVVTARGYCNKHYARFYAQGRFKKNNDADVSSKNLTDQRFICDNPSNTPVNIRGDSVPKERLHPLGVNYA